MNEADSPDQQPGLPVPIEPVQMPAATESIAAEVPKPAPSEDWQTVDFPGAMSIDAIPHNHAQAGHTEGWGQTNALNQSVSQGIIHYSGAEISPTVAYSAAFQADADSLMQMQQLQQENAVLHDRLAQAEQALVPQRAGQPTMAGEGSSAFEPTQQHLQQLLQELERSHQAAQRQQILVETLTEQLGSSQERIAQLERDCALTQQRHNEQVQQVLQAESDCRDLRLRLHRQQQQTLQFKAALEKCLEMPTAYSNPVTADVALASDPTTEALSAFLPKNPPVKPWSLSEKALQDPAPRTDRSRSLLKLLNHRSSAQSDAAESTNELAQGQAVSDVQAVAPFSDRSTNGEPIPAEPSALLDSDDPQFVTHLMQLIFPTIADQSSYIAADALQSEPLSELTPFAEADVETESADTTETPTLDVSSAVTFIAFDRPAVWMTAALETAVDDTQHNTVSASPDAIASDLPATQADDRSTDPLWDHLATLIDPPLPIERATPAVAEAVDQPDKAVASAPANVTPADFTNLVPLEPRPSLPPSTTAIPPIFTANAIPAVAAPPSEDSAATAQTAWTWRDRLVSASKDARSTSMEHAVQPAKLLALSTAGRQTVQQPASDATPAVPTSTLVMAPPSPIVYPQRSTKKLASLAAVDLPTFPKR